MTAATALAGALPIRGLDLRLTEATWAFARDQRHEIDRHWAALQRANPRIWNGETLMALEAAIEPGGVLRARFARTDYASFIAWRDWGWPDRTVFNCFGSAVVIADDGALLFGQMGVQTLNAGACYPPGGSLEPADADAAGLVDVIASIERELKEETGLEAREARRGELLAVFDGQRLSVAQAYRFAEPADALAGRIDAFIAGDAHAELQGVTILRSRSDIESDMQGYAIELVRYFLG